MYEIDAEYEHGLRTAHDRESLDLELSISTPVSVSISFTFTPIPGRSSQKDLIDAKETHTPILCEWSRCKIWTQSEDNT